MTDGTTDSERLGVSNRAPRGGDDRRALPLALARRTAARRAADRYVV